MTIDTTPVHVLASGTLSLDVMIYPHSDGQVEVKGDLSFAVSKTVDSALSFLPPIVRWGLSSSLIQRELQQRVFTFKVGSITEVQAKLTEDGIMTLSSRYKNPLARPVGHSETSRIFRRFAKELAGCGLTPNCNQIIEDFIKDFSRHDRADLPFLALFEGRSIITPTQSTPPITNLTLQKMVLSQDQLGDLVVSFEAVARVSEEAEAS